MNYRVVPDSLRERDPLRKGRPPTNEVNKRLLDGQTIFVSGPKKGWGNLYKLAANHKMKCHTKATEVNNEIGTLIWFESSK